MKLTTLHKLFATLLVVFVCSFAIQAQTVTKETTKKSSLSATSSKAETTPVKAVDKDVKTTTRVNAKSDTDHDKAKSDKDHDKVKPSERDYKDTKKHSSKDLDKKKMTPDNKKDQEKKKSLDATGGKK